MKFTAGVLYAASLASSVAAFGHHAMVSRPSETNSSVSIPVAPSQDPWYMNVTNYKDAAPGTILKIRDASGLTQVQTNSSAAYQILYRTTNSRYKPTWAVTTLLIPAVTNSNSTKNNKLLSYQIPYDSADVDSSPSYSLYSGATSDITAALGRGWYVNVPDYEGPLASFVAGVQSGHATLDSVRAVLNSGFGLSESARYALWGYSGGALASEWAAELQVQYASELDFAGAALGGLTPNVSNVLTSVDATFEAGLIPAGILGLASQWPELKKYINQNLKTTGQYNATGFLAAVNYTLIEEIGTYFNQDITQYFKNGVSTLFSSVAQKVINSDGVMGYHGVPQMPLFAYKAIKDEVSPVADTDKLVARYCEVGATIKYERNTVGSHTGEEGNGDARAFTFLTSVLSGNYNATGCQISNVTVGQ